MASTGEAASSVLALELELISAPAAAQMERRRRAETKAFREGMTDELVIDEMCLTPTDYLFCWLTRARGLTSCFYNDCGAFLNCSPKLLGGMCLQTQVAYQKVDFCFLATYGSPIGLANISYF